MTRPTAGVLTRFSLVLVLAAAIAVAVPSTANAQAAAAGDGPAQDATTCIAIVLPSVNGVEGNAINVAEGLRDLFAGYLTGPSIKSISLEARLFSQALEEARTKQCGHILVSTLTRKRTGGGSLGKALGQAAGTAAHYLPGGRTAGTAVARGAAIAGAQAVSSLAGSTRAKDEMRLDYRVSPLDHASKANATTLRAKASSDGEDLLTPMVEKASEAVAAAATRR